MLSAYNIAPSYALCPKLNVYQKRPDCAPLQSAHANTRSQTVNRACLCQKRTYLLSWLIPQQVCIERVHRGLPPNEGAQSHEGQ